VFGHHLIYIAPDVTYWGGAGGLIYIAPCAGYWGGEGVWLLGVGGGWRRRCLQQLLKVILRHLVVGEGGALEEQADGVHAQDVTVCG